MLSGPYGGDAQITAMVAEGRVNAVFFFLDPLVANIASAVLLINA